MQVKLCFSQITHCAECPQAHRGKTEQLRPTAALVRLLG